ncbi:MAG: efflux RND transporter periplasmic adaptor subunit [Planctomycetota bacterium]
MAPVVVSDIPVEYEFVGRTESSRRVEIRARVSGYLDEIAYEEGEFVNEDQTLFKLDPSPFQAALRAAKAELAQQQARLDNAEALLARIEPLAAADAVSDKELDDARDSVRESAAAVEAAAAGVFEAELDLSYTTIISPVTGLTGEATEREGAYIAVGSDPLTYVARIDPMWVEFSITESQLLRGQSEERSGSIQYPADRAFDVFIELSDGTVVPNPGRISFADASVSTSTGSVLFRAVIPNPQQSLRPGQYVRVFVRGAYRPDAMAVPQTAVLEGPKGAFVWTVGDDGTAEQRPVTTGPWHGDAWIIEDGLRLDDRVLVSGLVGMRPQTPLRIIGEGVPEAPADAAPGDPSS